MYAFFIHLFMWIMVQCLEVKSLHYPAGYIGCYKDDKIIWLSYQRVLHTKLEYPDLNCAAKCKEECTKLGFRYAGTESGEECFCGNEINQNPDKVPDTECNVPCPGQKDENCGGYWLISIYDTSKTMKDRSGPTTVTGDDFDQATSRFQLSPAVTVSPTQAEGLTTPTTATDEKPTEASDPTTTQFIPSSADTVSTQGLTTPTTATDEKPTEASDPTTTQFIPSSADTVSAQGLTTPTTATDEIPAEASDPTTPQFIPSSADTVSTQGLTTPTTATGEIPTEASDPTTTQIIPSTVDTVSSTQAVRTKLLKKHTTATDGIKLISCFSKVTKQYPANYIGCYKDVKGSVFSEKDVPTKRYSSNANRNVKCKNQCKHLGYKYSGTEEEKLCFCGNEIKPNAEKVPDSDCSYRCPGQEEENCGGDKLMSIYKTQILTVEVTTDGSKHTTLQPIVLSANFSSTSNAKSGPSGTRKKSFPAIYVLIPVGVIATVVAISVVVLLKRRRKSVQLLPDVRYNAACSTRETSEDDTEACQFLKNMSKHNATNLSA